MRSIAPMMRLPLQNQLGRLSRARRYALCGAVLSQGSPVGGLLLQMATRGVSAKAELAEHGALYVYMGVATLIAFSAFGYGLGHLADDLTAHARELRKVNQRLRRLSNVDGLTGLLTRRAVRRRLRAELKRAQRDDRPTALVSLDLDLFKQVNDQHGHVMGDRVLRRVGLAIRRLARASDSAGRLGGDEFLIVLPATSLGEACRFAERLRATIARHSPASQTPAVTVSLGVYERAGQAVVDVEEALQNVDATLYHAKAAGRDRVSPKPDDQEARRSVRASGGSGSIS
jgi:diguanylate cyclase (GGDEF)-like protein